MNKNFIKNNTTITNFIDIFLIHINFCRHYFFSFYNFTFFITLFFNTIYLLSFSFNNLLKQLKIFPLLCYIWFFNFLLIKHYLSFFSINLMIYYWLHFFFLLLL